jgi:ABC-2 type transport system ATP-binding protein
MTTTTVIDVSDVSKRFVIRKEKSLKERMVNFGRSNLHKDDFWALRDVDLKIGSGSTVGLIGPNGSGKSTLLKMIGGILQPTTGSVRLRGRLAALLELGAGFHPDLTGRENVYLNAAILGITREQTARYFDAIVDFSGIEPFIDTQVKFYSSGMYVRLAFAVAVHVDPDILLVDEVLAVGDEPFQRKCMDRIRGFQHEGRTIVLVTHSLETVADLCDRAIVLERGAVIADGAPRESLRTLRTEFEHAREAEIARTETRAGVAAQAPARIEQIELLDAAGAPVRTVQPGDGLAVRLTVRADEPLAGANVGIGVETSLGVSVYGTSTKLLGRTLDLDGTEQLTFRVNALHLGEGSYTVHGAVAAASGQEVHRLMEGATFTVTGDGRGVGVLSADVDLDR